MQGNKQQYIAENSNKEQLNAVLKKDSIIENDFEAKFPAKSMYASTDLLYTQKEYAGGLTDLHMLGKMKVPIHKYFVLRLKLGDIADKYIDKALIVELSNDLKKSSAVGGKYNDGWMQAEVRSFGNYTVKIDTVCPKISPINFYEGKNMQGINELEFKISDNLSGIQDYDVWIDDQWVLSNYLPKKAKLIVVFNKYNKIEKGEHLVKISVIDERGNKAEKMIGFKY